MITKPWYQSKTIWFNILIGIVGILSLPTTLQLFPVVDMPFLLGINAAGNWILRTYFTSTGIAPAQTN